LATFGSSFSLMVSPQVVCGVKTVTTPSVSAQFLDGLLHLVRDVHELIVRVRLYVEGFPGSPPSLVCSPRAGPILLPDACRRKDRVRKMWRKKCLGLIAPTWYEWG
jgi:hypothetical protein